MSPEKFNFYFPEFESVYDSNKKTEIWTTQSRQFRDFWLSKVMSSDTGQISDEDCDKIIKVLDRNGRGNKKGSEAIARAMVSQGAWRRLFNELHKNKKLAEAVDRIFGEKNQQLKAKYIDDLYAMSGAQGIYLTGKSGNVICIFLAALDPFCNLSIISLKDRRSLLDFFKSKYLEDFDKETIGSKIINSNPILSDIIKQNGVTGDARKISEYCYYSPVKELWRGEFSTPKDSYSSNSNKEITVTVAPDQELVSESADENFVRDSFKIQGLLAKIGEEMGFQIWLPNPDRVRISKVWQPKNPKTLLTNLPFQYGGATQTAISLIDVIWVRHGRSIARAFEVEHTTSIYSGILRMADLVALQPDIKIKMHIVAPLDRQEKFISEIRRPVFSYMVNGRLSNMCTFISYDDVRDIASLEYLSDTKDTLLENYEITAEQPDE